MNLKKKQIKQKMKTLLIILSSLLLILGGIVIYQKDKINKQDIEIGRISNNVAAYEDMINGYVTDNRTLQLKIGDISNSKDKVIQELDSTRKVLKLTKVDLKQATSIKTKIQDTVNVVIPNITTEDSIKINNCDFSIKHEINSETIISVSRNDSLLTIITDIKNTQFLYIYSKKEYRNDRKNWFDRLFHWDWKKDIINRYEIANSNPSIKIESTRIIEIKE